MARSTAQRNAARKRQRQRANEQRKREAIEQQLLSDAVDTLRWRRDWRIDPEYRARTLERWVIPDEDGFTGLKLYAAAQDKRQDMLDAWRLAFVESGGWLNVPGIMSDIKQRAQDRRTSVYGKAGSHTTALDTRGMVHAPIKNLTDYEPLPVALSWDGINTQAQLVEILNILNYQWSI